jgi:DNA repair protein RadD
LVVAPCGSGKSLMIAEGAGRAVLAGSRVIVCAHVKELLVQNRAALAKLDPALAEASTNACAGLGSVDFSGRVVFASPHTVAARLDELPAFDLVLIDEAHLVPTSEASQYRRIIRRQRELNPRVRLGGFTATPYRLDSGRLDDGDLFDTIAYEIDVRTLLDAGHLVPLVAPETAAAMDVAGIAERREDFAAGELHARFASDGDHAGAVAREIVPHLEARRSGLVFAIDREHARLLAEALAAEGVSVASVFGDTPADERAGVLDAFKAGRVAVLVNVEVATTGFDAPGVDLLALCRPTTSTALHVQMLGRGMRPAPGKADCLVLDFAGNVGRLGLPTAPRISVQPKREAAETAVEVDAPAVERDRTPYRERIGVRPAGSLDGPAPVPVVDVGYRRHDKPGAPPSLRVSYRLNGHPARAEWLALWHPNPWARNQARRRWHERAPQGTPTPRNIEEALRLAPRLAVPPAVRVVSRPGKPDAVEPVWEREVAHA